MCPRAVPPAAAPRAPPPRALLPFILDFFERRVFGAARLDLLNEQLADQAKSEQTSARKERAELQRQVADLDQAIKRQVIAIEQGVEPALVGARIAELKEQKATAETALRELPEDAPDPDDLAPALDPLPNFSAPLRRATPEVQRALFESFNLQVVFDKQTGKRPRVRVSATVTDAVAQALGSVTELPAAAVASAGIAGAGFEPATFGL